MEFLQTVYANLVAIIKIYVKFAAITLLIYFVAEWYLLHYGDLSDALAAENIVDLVGIGKEQQASNSSSTLVKVYRFMKSFLVL